MSGNSQAKKLKGKGGSHGICSDEVNADLLAFFKGQALSAGSGREASSSMCSG